MARFCIVWQDQALYGKKMAQCSTDLFTNRPIQATMTELLAIDQNLIPSAKLHVLFCGGFHSSMRGTKASHMAQLCKQARLSFTRFDYRGHGETEGNLDQLHLGDWLEDTLNVMDQCDGRLILVGSSMGAWLATLAARAQPERIQALLLVAAAPDFITELLWEGLPAELQKKIEQQEIVRIANRYDDKPWPLHQALFTSGKQLSVLGSGTLQNIRCPVRLLHGTADQDVPWQQSLRLMQELPEGDSSLLLLNNADHRLSDERSLAALASALDELQLRVHC